MKRSEIFPRRMEGPEKISNCKPLSWKGALEEMATAACLWQAEPKDRWFIYQ